MRRFIFFLFIALSFCITPHSLALEPFIQTSGVTFHNEFYEWNETEHTQASVLSSDNLFKQWYTSKDKSLKIAYAESRDGISWIGKKLYNFSQNGDSHDPSVVKLGDKYLLFFAMQQPGELTKIFMNESLNGVDFNNNSQIILEAGNDWERFGITSPVIYSDNSIYYLFYSGNNGHWGMGLATSNDGTSFMKCQLNPILQDDSVPKSIIKLSNTYYLFFHSLHGIEYMETDKLGCDSVWKNRTVVFPYGFYPYVLRVGNELRLYYSTLENGQWKMNLATSNFQEQTVEKKPFILIPGLFASWNKEAMLHDKPTDIGNWQINPIVKEYNGLTRTLDNLGYRKNTDYFMFPYDWRKPVEQSSVDLNSFITGLDLKEKPSLIGHSLGGLVGRIYAQKYGNSKIDKLITVGTPHQGTALVYTAVEAGETDKRDPYMWLTETLALQIYRNGFESNRDIVNEHLPVLQNMFPTYNFLLNSGQTVGLDGMTIKNNLLLQSYNTSFGSLYNQLYTLAGESGSTLLGYTVSKPAMIDKLMGIYPDGRPEDMTYHPGDGTIISFSATTGNNSTVINKNHGELVYSNQGIKTILNDLGVSVGDSQVIAGERTTVFPSLLFLILSPARLEVEGNGRLYTENEGIVFIENPAAGSYKVKAKGVEKGKYTILIGQLDKNKDAWNRIEGAIEKDPASSQTDSYTLNFNPDKPSSIILTREQLYKELYVMINGQNGPTGRKVNKAQDFLTKAEGAKEHPEQVRAFLRQAELSLMQPFEIYTTKQKLTVIRMLEPFEQLFSYNPQPVDPQGLNLQINRVKTTNERIAKILVLLQTQGVDIKEKAYILSVAGEKAVAAEQAISSGNFSHAEGLVNSAQLLIQTLPGYSPQTGK